MPPKAQPGPGRAPNASSSTPATSSPQAPRQDWMVWALQLKKEHHALLEQMDDVEKRQGACDARIKSFEVTAANLKHVDMTMKDLSNRLTALQADEKDLDDCFKKDRVQIEKEIEKTARMQQELQNLETRSKCTNSEVMILRSETDATKQKVVTVEETLLRQEQNASRLPRRNDPDDVRALKARLDFLESRGRDERKALQDKVAGLERKNQQLNTELARLKVTIRTPHQSRIPVPSSEATTEYFPSSRLSQVQVLGSPVEHPKEPSKRNMATAFREESPISEAQRRRTTKLQEALLLPPKQRQQTPANLVHYNVANPHPRVKRHWTYRAEDLANPGVDPLSSQLSLHNIVSGNRRAKLATTSIVKLSTQTMANQEPSIKKVRRSNFRACERCHLRRTACEDARPCSKCVAAGVDCVARDHSVSQARRSQRPNSRQTSRVYTSFRGHKQAETQKSLSQKPEASRRSKRHRRALIEEEDDQEFLKLAWAGYKG